MNNSILRIRGQLPFKKFCYRIIHTVIATILPDLLKDTDTIIFDHHFCGAIILSYVNGNFTGIRVVYRIIHHFCKRVLPDFINIIWQNFHYVFHHICEDSIFLFILSLVLFFKLISSPINYIMCLHNYITKKYKLYSHNMLWNFL